MFFDFKAETVPLKLIHKPTLKHDSLKCSTLEGSSHVDAVKRDEKHLQQLGILRFNFLICVRELRYTPGGWGGMSSRMSLNQ